MDRVLEKKKGIQKKHIPFIAVGVLVLTLIGWIIFGNHAKTLSVNAKSVTVSNVTAGEFKDYVRVTGVVQPKTIIQLSPLEGGIVEEKVREEGAMVKKGDVIIRLSNSTLNLSILDSEASLAEKENFLRNTRVTMEQEKLSLKQEMIQLITTEKRDERKSVQYKKLYAENLVSKEDYLQAQEDYELSQERRKLVLERQKQDSIFREIQIDNMEISLTSMKKNMTLTYERLENLNVKSPIDGQLGTLDIVLGQSVTSGMKIGQINDLDDFKIAVELDEHYIDRVRVGLSGSFERSGTDFAVEVSKVYPDVAAGKFKSDLLFVGERPDNIRAGQSYYINLELGTPTQAILVPRGAFYQKSGGNWIFVVDESGTRAYKRDIKISRQNPQYYEVTEGLTGGEKVITSSYDNFGDNDVIELND